MMTLEVSPLKKNPLRDNRYDSLTSTNPNEGEKILNRTDRLT